LCYLFINGRGRDTIIIRYIPTNEGTIPGNLLIYTQCLYWNLYIYGGSGFPKIVKAGNSLTINYTRCHTNLVDYDSVSLYFESNAFTDLEPEYDNVAFLEGYGWHPSWY
jgi:hypothetical protein